MPRVANKITPETISTPNKAMIDMIEEMKKAAIVAATLAGFLTACAAVDSAFPAESTVEKLDRLMKAGEFADCETDGEITARAAGLGLDLDELHAAGVMPF